MAEPKITNRSLLNNKYDIKTLEDNLDVLDFKILLRTQTLTAEFCVKYILNDDYASCIEDTYYFDYSRVLLHQTHLTAKQLDEAYEQIHGQA
jgi:hypothetical protein